jgi:VCBS repeat protein
VVGGLPALLAALAVASTPVFGPLTPKAQIPSDGYLSQIVVADVTGDGIPDIVGARVTSAGEAHPLVVLAGDGKGGFRDVTAQVFVGPVTRTVLARQILFADFNGDGRTDIFIADTGPDRDPYGGAPNELVLSAPGGKLLDAGGNLPPESAYTHAAAAGDVNHDGAPDLYIGNLCCNLPPEILLNDGTGHFSRLADALPTSTTDVFNGARYTAAVFADVNGDGWDDLVLAAENHTPSNGILLNDQHGHLVPLAGAMPAKPFGPDAIGLAVAPIDLNRDGHVDLAVAYTRGSPFYTGRWLQLLVNNGSGLFTDDTAKRLPQTLDETDWPYALHVADLNGDGKQDIAVAVNAFGPPTGAVYLNRGDGTFAPLIMSSHPYADLDVADVNRDGRPDLVSAAAGPVDVYAVNLQLEPTNPKQVVPRVTVLTAKVKRSTASVCWRGNSAAVTYDLALRRPHTAWKTVARASQRTCYALRGKKSERYEFRVRARDQQLAYGPWSGTRAFTLR